MPNRNKAHESTNSNKSKARGETSNNTGEEFLNILKDSYAGIKSLGSFIYAGYENLSHRLKKILSPTY